MNPEKNPITVEDLLHLKRAERPPVEFWAEFDRELRTKQLAALVAKKPWWQALPGAVLGSTGSLARYRFPLGAAAALALTFVAVREYAGPSDVLDAEALTTANVRQSVAAVSPPAELPAKLVPTAHQAPAVAIASTTRSAGESEIRDYDESGESEAIASRAEIVAASVAPSVSTESSGGGGLQLSRLVSFLGNDIPESSREISPSSRYISANLAEAQALDAVATGLLTVQVSQGFASRAMPAARGTAVDPLQQITPPGELRRSRYLTAMVAVVNDESLERTTARMADRISGQELYEQVRRFGTRRGGINVKF